MTIDNYEKAKQYYVTDGLGERNPGHIDELKAALKQTEAQQEADKLVSRYRSNPDVLKVALETINQSQNKSQRELVLEAEIARLKGGQTGQGLWAS
jgi:Flp pilus assembly protein TadD